VHGRTYTNDSRMLVACPEPSCRITSREAFEEITAKLAVSIFLWKQEVCSHRFETAALRSGHFMRVHAWPKLGPRSVRKMRVNPVGWFHY